MNLCIDQGNTRVKLALFEQDGTMVERLVWAALDEESLSALLQQHDIENCILSSVGEVSPIVTSMLNRQVSSFVQFDRHTPIPIRNGYDTPETLGYDRLAAAIGANCLCPNQNLLVIDAGSAITYDLVSSSNEYLGGNIAPGMSMRFRALHEHTSKLPLVAAHDDVPEYGKNTHDAILAGVVRGLTFEIEGYIRSLQDRVGQITTFLTGGDAAFLQKNLASSVRLEKDLLLTGLHCILQYNIARKR